MSRELTIGKVARAASVNVETVRYYQRSGLLPVPPRPAGRMRAALESLIGRCDAVRGRIACPIIRTLAA